MPASPRAHVLDKLIGGELPRFETMAQVAAFEASAPYAERVAAQSTYQALQLGAALDPQAPALHFLQHASPDETPFTWTHGQLIARVTQAANAFHALGIGRGDVVSLLLPLLPQAFAALFGAQAVGVANPVNPMLSAGQIADILRAAGTRVLVTFGPSEGSDLWDKVTAVRYAVPTLRTVLVVGGARHPGLEADDFDARLDGQPGSHLSSGRLPNGDDTAGYFHTGGTTGTPKLVRHSHANQVSQAWALRLMGLAGPGQGVLFGLPLFHVGGALTQGLSPLANGGHVVVLSPAGWRDPHALPNVWKLVQRYRPRLFGAVPTVLAGALQVPVNGADVSSLKRVSGGGSAIPVAVIQAYERQMKVPVLEVYGMTETSSVHTMSYPDMAYEAGSVGRPLPYARTRVVKLDADGRLLGDCAPNEIGVVAMAGPGVFDGYLSEQHNQGAFVEPGLGQLGRPRSPRRARPTVDHRPRQGPHHPRRAQHRSRATRRVAVPPSGRGTGGAGRPAGRVCRRTAGGLRAAQARRQRVARGTDRLLARAHAGARRGAGGAALRRSDAAHCRGQDLQAGAACRRDAPRGRAVARRYRCRRRAAARASGQRCPARPCDPCAARAHAGQRTRAPDRGRA